MINGVYEAVLAILNKHNYGNVPPQDFNTFARKAQIDIFEDYFYRLNNAINKGSARLSGTDYADTEKHIKEAIEKFHVHRFLVNKGGNVFFLPSETTTGEDYYRIDNVYVHKYSNIVEQDVTYTGNIIGQVTPYNWNSTTDAEATITPVIDTASGMRFDDANETMVMSVVDNDRAEVYTEDFTDILAAGSNKFIITRPKDRREAEKLTHQEARRLEFSNHTEPTLDFPAYSQNEDVLQMYPRTIVGVKRGNWVSCDFVRYPKVPKWTYTTFKDGDPLFNPAASDFQDLELPRVEFPKIVRKILILAGMSIRETEAVQMAQFQENYDTQEKNRK